MHRRPPTVGLGFTRTLTTRSCSRRSSTSRVSSATRWQPRPPRRSPRQPLPQGPPWSLLLQPAVCNLAMHCSRCILSLLPLYDTISPLHYVHTHKISSRVSRHAWRQSKKLPRGWVEGKDRPRWLLERATRGWRGCGRGEWRRQARCCRGGRGRQVGGRRRARAGRTACVGRGRSGKGAGGGGPGQRGRRGSLLWVLAEVPAGVGVHLGGVPRLHLLRNLLPAAVVLADGKPEPHLLFVAPRDASRSAPAPRLGILNLRELQLLGSNGFQCCKRPGRMRGGRLQWYGRCSGSQCGEGGQRDGRRSSLLGIQDDRAEHGDCAMAGFLGGGQAEEAHGC